jgi:hypothetical protein
VRWYSIECSFLHFCILSFTAHADQHPCTIHLPSRDVCLCVWGSRYQSLACRLSSTARWVFGSSTRNPSSWRGKVSTHSSRPRTQPTTRCESCQHSPQLRLLRLTVTASHSLTVISTVFIKTTGSIHHSLRLSDDNLHSSGGRQLPSLSVTAALHSR